MNLIDTHLHLTFDDFKDDIDGVLARSVEAGVTSWITIGTEPGEQEKVVEFAERYNDIHAVIGYHPHEAKSVTDGDISLLNDLLTHPKVVGIGEAGLDYFYDYSPREIQRNLFRKQLQIAADNSMPVVVHTRNAFEETMEILDEFRSSLSNVVVHCFSGNVEQAKAVLDKGYHVSFTGIVTFKNAEEARNAAKLVPLDRLMIETDAPFISPVPVRNVRPCEPAMMIHTARKIAEVKGMDFEEFAQKVTQTSKTFFGLD